MAIDFTIIYASIRCLSGASKSRLHRGGISRCLRCLADGRCPWRRCACTFVRDFLLPRDERGSSCEERDSQGLRTSILGMCMTTIIRYFSSSAFFVSGLDVSITSASSLRSPSPSDNRGLINISVPPCYIRTNDDATLLAEFKQSFLFNILDNDDPI